MPVETSARLANGDHVVQFYDRDDDLVGVVGAYLAASVLDGDFVIVVATPAHLEAFREVLVASGVDVDAAQVGGGLTMLDAAATLGRFVVDGSPDALGFAEHIRGLIGPSTADGRQVRVYGEMVALLWDAGNVAGAIELERLWNEIGADLPFSLFCAYPAHLVSDAHSADAFAEVCHLHSNVLAYAPPPPGAEVTRRFAGTPQALRLARGFVAETLQCWHRVDLVDDAVLIVSELATNAVLHAGSDYTVALSLRGGGLYIGVADSSTDLPRPRDPDSIEPGGRGLHLVGAMASRCGHDLVEGGKMVWAELGVGDAAGVFPHPVN